MNELETRLECYAHCATYLAVRIHFEICFQVKRRVYCWLKLYIQSPAGGAS